MTKIGIDLSTTSTGVVILSKIKPTYFCQKLWSDNNFERAVLIKQFVDKIINNCPEDTQYLVGIEVSNFKNAKLSCRFNLLAGGILQELNKRLKLDNQSLKIFNSNQWQKIIGCGIHEERDVRKTRARDFAFKHGFKQAFHVVNDITDAFCIALLLDRLDDVTTIAKNTKANRLNNRAHYKQVMRAKLNEAKRSSVLNKKIKRYELLLASGKRLTKAQEKALNKLKGEYEKIRD